ncbi:MAG: hypothetical protein M8354_13505, partial [Halalkalicoccus sp.]|nr:hypothetical protein [Halalkalicoccus sp.]
MLYTKELIGNEYLPKEIQGVPTVIKEIEEIEYKPNGCRNGVEYNTLKSNMDIGVDTSSNTQTTGTIGVIGYNANPYEPYKCIVTACHVVDD